MREINSSPQRHTVIGQRLFLRVQFLRIFFLIGCLGAIHSGVFAQDDAPAKRKGSRIVDDTTKQVYGAKTSLYYFEKDVFLNRPIYHLVDTAIHNYHRFNFVQRFNNLYQDLGNIGTSIRPIYYQTPEYIGVTSGFNSFNLYWDTENVKYYDTKSPFSNLKVVLGGLGRSMTNVAFSRNINPRWNFGFNYRALLIDKQVQRAGKGDRNVKSTYYDLYTAYQNKDSTYRLFVNFRRHYYQANENGGVVQPIDPVTLQPYSDLSRYFDLEGARPELTKATSEELRTNFHLFHQYQIFGKGFQVYHILDAYQQNNYFHDITSAELSTKYFDYTNIQSDTVNDGVRFKTLRNEMGLKGNLAKLFYCGYYAIRHYDMSYSNYQGNKVYNYLRSGDVTVPLNGNEHYLGGKMSLLLDSIGEVHGWAEIESNGYYRLEGDIRSKWFEASLKEMKYAPSYLQQTYNASHDYWTSHFSGVNVTQINGYLHYNSRVLKVSPGLTFTRLNNYAYFAEIPVTPESPTTQKVSPIQSKGSQVIASPELWLSLTFLKHITISTQTIYTKLLKNDDNAISVPQLLFNGQLSYANIFYHGNMDMQTGVDIHWKSSYYAMGYDPVIQQFYTQINSTLSQGFLSKSFPVVDVFFNMKVKKGRIFVKYNNIVQAITKSGYFPTPYYPGQRPSIDFGFDFLFYD